VCEWDWGWNRDADGDDCHYCTSCTKATHLLFLAFPSLKCCDVCAETVTKRCQRDNRLERRYSIAKYKILHGICMALIQNDRLRNRALQHCITWGPSGAVRVEVLRAPY
jgi:hypothetical protein